MCTSDGIIYPGYEYKHKGNDDKNDIILPSIEEQIDKQTTECKKTLVVFIGGAADYKFQPLLKQVFARYEKAYGRGINRLQDVCYSEHGGGNVPPLMKKWSDANQDIVLVGHSWGGDRAIKLAEKNSNIPIKLLVTLDPVSWGKNGKQPKPSNVERWINVYVDYKHADYSEPNIVARAGHPWQFCKNADKNHSVNTVDGKKVNNAGHAHVYDMFDKSGVEYEVLKL